MRGDPSLRICSQIEPPISYPVCAGIDPKRHRVGSDGYPVCAIDPHRRSAILPGRRLPVCAGIDPSTLRSSSAASGYPYARDRPAQHVCLYCGRATPYARDRTRGRNYPPTTGYPCGAGIDPRSSLSQGENMPRMRGSTSSSYGIAYALGYPVCAGIDPG